jgi:hypothetical protein
MGEEVLALRGGNEYKKMRAAYRPEHLKAIFVLESPPRSGKYFYNPLGSNKEQLFSAMMKVIDVKPANKEKGLRAFQQRGFIIVDACYTPVNGLKGKARDELILREYDALLDDLAGLNPKKNIPLVLVKANICKLLEPRLREEGFKILNGGEKIPFPGSGQQRKFQMRMRKCWKASN